MLSHEDLHDAIVDDLRFEWREGRVRIELTVVARPKSPSVAATWDFENVTLLRCPRAFPWGPSSSINVVAVKRDVDSPRQIVEIEMQSGDVIRVECARWTFVERAIRKLTVPDERAS